MIVNKKMKIVIGITILSILILLLRFYFGLIVGEFPKVESLYNTVYSPNYSSQVFESIGEGENKESIYRKLGEPLKLSATKYKEKEYELYYYSYIREGKKFGKIGSINARIIIFHDNKVVDRVSERLLLTNIYPNSLLKKVMGES